jgi:metal-responsive CopG/Arc/MetJ family transcriptional regulator
METEVSISDDLYLSIEKIQKQQKINISTFINNAIHLYLKYLDEKNNVDKINEVYFDNSNNDIAFINNYKSYVAKNLQEKEDW